MTWGSAIAEADEAVVVVKGGAAGQGACVMQADADRVGLH